jgi:hypothetical protein
LRQKARFLRPPDRRGSGWSLFLGVLFVGIAAYALLRGDPDPYLRAWELAVGGAVACAGLSGRLPADHRRAAVGLRVASAALFLAASAVAAATLWAGEGWWMDPLRPRQPLWLLFGRSYFGEGGTVPEPPEGAGLALTAIVYVFLAFVVPTAVVLLGYGLGRFDRGKDRAKRRG